MVVKSQVLDRRFHCDIETTSFWQAKNCKSGAPREWPTLDWAYVVKSAKRALSGSAS